MGEEGEIEDYFTERAENMGAEVRKLAWVNRRGAPDRFVALKGVVLLIEFKAPGEKLRPNQKKEHEKLKRAGVNVITIENRKECDNLLILMGKLCVKEKKTVKKVAEHSN